MATSLIQWRFDVGTESAECDEWEPPSQSFRQVVLEKRDTRTRRMIRICPRLSKLQTQLSRYLRIDNKKSLLWQLNSKKGILCGSYVIAFAQYD